MPRVGITADHFSKTLPFPEYLKLMKLVRAEAFEIINEPGSYAGTVRFDAEGAKEILSQTREAGFEISAVHGMVNFCHTDPDKMKAAVDDVKAKIDLAERLGVKVISTYAGEDKEGLGPERALKLMVKGLKPCAEYAAERGIALAMQNHGALCNYAEVQLKIIEMVGFDSMRLNCDNSNYRWFGHDTETVKRYIEMTAPYIVHTHIKDGKAVQGYMGDYDRGMLGEGEMDLVHMMRCLYKAGYNRALTVQNDPPTRISAELKAISGSRDRDDMIAAVSMGMAYMRGLLKGLEPEFPAWKSEPTFKSLPARPDLKVPQVAVS